MRFRHLMVGAALLFVLSLAHADDPPAPAKTAIDRLIAQLGSDSFLEREQARKELRTIGPPALAALRRAEHAGDLETSRRAAELVRVIEEQVLTAALLAPKRVRLSVKDMPVLQAVAQLAKLSGYALRVDGDRTVLAGKTVTLDTGDVTFWEAVDRLGAATGLVEKLTVAALPGEPGIGNEMFYELDATVLRFNRRGRLMRKVVRPVAPPVPPLRIVPVPAPAKVAAKQAADKAVIERLDALINDIEKNGLAAKTPAPIMPGCVILTPGRVGTPFASYAGAVRVLLKQPTRRVPAIKGCDLVLAASAEPRLLGFTLVGVPIVARAVDEHGQVLSFVIDPTAAATPATSASLQEALKEFLDGNAQTARLLQTGVTIRLESGAKPAKRLRELSGSLAAQIFLPNTTLMTLDHVLKATGKFAGIKGGGRLLLDSISIAKIGGGAGTAVEYQIVCKLDSMPTATTVLRNGCIVNVSSGALGNDMVPELRDAKGQRLTLVNGPLQSGETDAQGQQVRTSVTMQFRREAGQGEPAQLLLIGTDTPTIRVPFRFEDVPLR